MRILFYQNLIIFEKYANYLKQKLTTCPVSTYLKLKKANKETKVWKIPHHLGPYIFLP